MRKVNQMKKIIVFTIIIAVSFLLSSDQGVLTFKDAVAIALKQNLQIEIARNNAAIAKNNVHIGKADLLPEIGFSSSTTYQDGQATLGTSDSSTTTDIKLQASYTLFDGLGNVYRYKKLQTDGRIGELEARDLIENVLMQVSEAYYSAAAALENLQIAQELLSISKERLDRSKKRSAYGRARTIDVLSARVDLKTDEVTLTHARFAWDEAKRKLNVLLNKNINHEFTVKTGVDFKRELDLETIKTEATSRNASFLATGERLNLSRYDLNIARSSYLPRLNLTSSYGFSQNSPGWHIGLNDPDKTFRIGATLSLNLFNGFKDIIKNRNARITLKNQELKIEQARLDLEKEVISAFESYKNSLQVLELEKQHLEAAELNFKRTQELYSLGQVTTTQFREAQLNLIRARSNLSGAKYDAKLREIELLRLSGQLVK